MTKSDKQAINRSNVYINEITKVKFFPRDNEPNTACVRNTVGEGFKKTTTAMATGKSLNKSLNKQNNGCAHAL